MRKHLPLLAAAFLIAGVPREQPPISDTALGNYLSDMADHLNTLECLQKDPRNTVLGKRGDLKCAVIGGDDYFCMNTSDGPNGGTEWICISSGGAPLDPTLAGGDSGTGGMWIPNMNIPDRTESGLLSSNPGNNSKCIRWIAPLSMTATTLGFEVVSGPGGGAICGGAIYEDADDGQRLLSTGATTCTAGVKKVSGLSAVNIQQGAIYRACVCGDNLTTDFRAATTNALGNWNTDYTNVAGFTGANGCTASGPPATTGATTESGSPGALMLITEE